MLDPSILTVRVFHDVLMRTVLADLLRQFNRDKLRNSIRVLPFDIPEQIVELLNDVRQPIKLRFRLAPAGLPGHWLQLTALITQNDLLHRLLLDTIAVHITRVENPLRQILFNRRGQLRH